MNHPECTQKGLIHIYCGDGKGKTTAAMGLCIRAAGNGKKVLVYQFLKTNHSGEMKILSGIPNITIIKSPPKMKFSIDMTLQEKTDLKNSYAGVFKHITEMVGQYDILIMDEIIYTINAGLFDESVLLGFLEHKPECLEVVLTGQKPGERLTELADYVSEIKKIKHPYDFGVKSRQGIES